jgi:hypothetical protein
MSKRDGTAAYQAPEAAHGEVSRAGDWWSVGMIVGEAALGRHPLALPDGSLPGERQILSELAQREVPGVDLIEDPQVRLLCQGLLTRDANRRWGADQVRDWLAGRSPATGFGVSTPGATNARVRTVRFAGVEHDSPSALAGSFTASPDDAGRLLFAEHDRSLLDDLRAMLRTAGLAEAQGVLDGYRSGAWEPDFLRLLVEMDSELVPVLAGQSMTPAAIGRLASEVVNTDLATAEQRRSLAWVVLHGAWQIWRGLPGMQDAGGAADRLALAQAELRAALAAAGGADGGQRLIWSDASGTTWIPEGIQLPVGHTVLLEADVVRGFWSATKLSQVAWTILQAVAPIESTKAVAAQLTPLRAELLGQDWWTRLADEAGLGSNIIAMTAVPLAQQAEAAFAGVRRERERQARSAAEAERRLAEERSAPVRAGLAAYRATADKLNRDLEASRSRRLSSWRMADLLQVLDGLRVARATAGRVPGIVVERSPLPKAEMPRDLPAKLQDEAALRSYLAAELAYRPGSSLPGVDAS